MSRYLLDTSTLIDYSKGRQPVEARLTEMIAAESLVGVSAISVAEFYAGLPSEHHEIWHRFFSALVYWPTSQEAAAGAGHYLYAFARRGVTLSTADALQAAVAHEHGAVLVTDNPRDYAMPGIQSASL